MSRSINLDILICPACKNDGLTHSDTEIRCKKCGQAYRYAGGKVYFSEGREQSVIDALHKIKHYSKKYARLYRLLIQFISPVCPIPSIKPFLKRYVERVNCTALNLGSGSSDISPYVTNVDLFDYDNVDLTCDVEDLPIRGDSVDVVINIALLEHVRNPEEVVREIHRILKPGGIVYSFVPFMQPFHASPSDYSRRTFAGMRVLFNDFKEMTLECSGGPISGFLWIFQEWLSLLLSFGIKPLHVGLSILFMVITFPVKFLDFVFVHHPMAKNISSGFLYIGTKGNS
jgi:SAM-dependent methyltransferase